MHKDTFLGIIVLGIILFLITYFTLLVRNRINKIHKHGPSTARKIMKDIEK